MHTTILTLWKQGKSQRSIAELTGKDRKTVGRVIKQFKTEGRETPAVRMKRSALTPYHEAILTSLESGLSAVRIYEKLKESGCALGYCSVKRYVASLRQETAICVRFHSEPGQEAQVDFGYIGLMPDPLKPGKRRKAWVFNMRLSYSRLDYYEVVFDQRVETFINCHENAFRAFGGVPGLVKIDNLKAAILEAHFYEPVYQSLYKRFSEHWGFDPLPCRVRRPQEKGKVEAGIKYIKYNFFAGRKFTTYHDLTTQLKRWVDGYCHERIHGTTKEKPKDLFKAHEKAALKPLAEKGFYRGTYCKRKVHKDCHVIIDNNYYSVPFEYVSQTVDVEVTSHTIRIFDQDKQIALHSKHPGKGHFITQGSHYPPYKQYTPQSPLYLATYHDKMRSLGEVTDLLFSHIVKAHPHHWYPIVKGILNLRKTYSDEVVRLSCQRALAFGVTHYRPIKRMCENGSCYLPLDAYEGEN